VQNWKRRIGAATLCLTMLSASPGVIAWQPSLTPMLDTEISIRDEAHLSLSGELVWEDLEGGFYAVNGCRLIGDQELFAGLLGQWVEVVGTVSREMSVYMTRAIVVEEITPVSEITLTGVVTFMDLEGGFYSVNGYRLVGDQKRFEQYLGLQVKLTGTLDDGMSIYMTKGIKVKQIELSERQTLTGELTWRDLETGFYAVAGYRLIGDGDQFAHYLGKQVMVVGTLSNEPSIYMTKAIKVEAIRLLPVEIDVPPADDRYRPLDATRRLPAGVSIDGTRANFSQHPEVVEGTLYIPLKALVKAAGGRVRWAGNTKTATVELADRIATFVVGEKQAEMNEHGVYYFQRNLITMAGAPLLLRGHTYVSADALSSVLGMMEETGAGDGALSLASAQAIKEQLQNQRPEDQMGEVVSGSIREVQTSGRTRFLLAGPEMSNGEPYLIWVTVSDDTNLLWSTGRAASLDDLTADRQVTVVLSGPILESYPAQGGARTVIIAADQSQAEPSTELFTGTIEDISFGERTRILVSGPAMSSGEPAMVWVTLSDDAQIFWWNNDNRPADISDLKVGQRVEVRLVGPLLMSYPAQGGADRVTILKQQ
jgi:hypothetical protein